MKRCSVDLVFTSDVQCAQTLMKRNSVYLVFVLGGAIVGERVRSLHSRDSVNCVYLALPRLFLAIRPGVRYMLSCCKPSVCVAGDCLQLVMCSTVLLGLRWLPQRAVLALICR